jgi:hypothetical protein
MWRKNDTRRFYGMKIYSNKEICNMVQLIYICGKILLKWKEKENMHNAKENNDLHFHMHMTLHLPIWSGSG